MLARFASIALLLPVAATVACTAATSDEVTRSTNSSLTTARPVLRVKASATAKEAVGVTEWRLYKGKRDFVVSGYDARGYAVKGLAFAFVGKSQATSSKIRVRLLDGSKTSGTYDFHAEPAVSGKPKSAAAAFLRYAAADLRSVARQTSASTHTMGHFLPNGTTGTTTPAPGTAALPTGDVCGPSLGDLGADGTACMQAILGSLLGGGTPNLQACEAVAQSVLSNLGQCMGGIGATANADPDADPNADPNAGQAPNGADPTGAQGNGNFDPGQAGQAADQASQDDTCASCPEGSGADDIAIDDDNGGVALDGP